MNSIFTIRLYVKMMLQEVSGTKIILLDRFTKRLLTLIYTHSEILEKDVLLIDMLDNYRRDQLPNISCIVFVSPEDSARKIREELKKPKYEEYYIFFTNVIEEEDMKEIAENDKDERIKSLKVLFTDYLSPDPTVFLLPIKSSIPLYVGRGEESGRMTCEKISRGIVSSVLTMTKNRPVIRYNTNSQACLSVAEKIHELLLRRDYSDSFSGGGRSIRESDHVTPPLVLILDRRHDPITPLLMQWTYQAMVHEIIGKGIKDNVIVLKQRKSKKKKEEDEEEDEGEDDDEEEDEDEKKDDKTEILFSPLSDEFLIKTRDHNWGKVCEKMKEQVDLLKKEMKNKDRVESVEEMKALLENYSHIKKLNRVTNDHMSLVYEMKTQIHDRKLMHMSKLEQEMVCGVGNSKHNEHWSALNEFLAGRIRKDDALRLSLIYIIRYEKHPNNRSQELSELLLQAGFEKSELDILHGIFRYGGERVRKSTELFGDTSGIKGIFTKVRSALKDVENVFTQHVPLMKKTVLQLIKKKLSDRLYPFLGPSTGGDNVRKIFVFMIGGVTYAEVKAVRDINKEFRKKRIQVMIGGTSLLNSRYFVKEMRSFLEKIGM